MKIRKLFFALSGIVLIAVSCTYAIKKPLSAPKPALTTVGNIKNELTTFAVKAEELTTQLITTVTATTKNAPSTTAPPSTKAPETTTQILSTTAATTKPVPVTNKKASLPKKENSETSCFDNCAFLGNSRFVAIKDSGLAPNVYPVVGLDVRTVFTKHVTNSDVVVIDELNGKDFDKVILLFGENECGWPNVDYFIEKYAGVISAVQERVPDAEIYLHAIIPISAEASAKNECGCNNDTIRLRNERIKQLADDMGVNFIEPPPCLTDSHGDLFADAASDGIHLNRKYTLIWLGYLEEILS